MYVSVASLRQIKADSVEKVFNSAFAVKPMLRRVNIGFFVQTHEQPFDKQGLSDVKARMKALQRYELDRAETKSQWLVAIENSINTSEFDGWKDVCHVLMANTDQPDRMFSATSFAIDIPSECVDAYHEAAKTDENVTLGMVADPENPSNWMLKRCNVDRALQIEDALERCMLSAHVTFVNDFPKAGVCFQDLSVILAQPRLFAMLVNRLCAFAKHALANRPPITHVVGLDARGFIYGPLLAKALGCGFVMARKAGKLPHSPMDKPISHTYTTEYSSETLEILPDLIHLNDNVLVVDDLIATGGSLAAARALVEKCGARVDCAICILGVKALEHVAHANFDRPVHILL